MLVSLTVRAAMCFMANGQSAFIIFSIYSWINCCLNICFLWVIVCSTWSTLMLKQSLSALTGEHLVLWCLFPSPSVAADYNPAVTVCWPKIHASVANMFIFADTGCSVDSGAFGIIVLHDVSWRSPACSLCEMTKNFIFYSLGGWVVSFCAACWSWFWSSTTLDCYVAPVGMINMLLQQPEAVSPTLEETFLWRKFHLPGKKKIQAEGWFGWVFEGHIYEKSFVCYLCMSAEKNQK